MNYFKNEKGSALLVVMLMFLVFTILGLAIVSSSLGGSNRTEKRETEVTENLNALKSIKEANALIQAFVEEKENESDNEVKLLKNDNIEHYDSAILAFINGQNDRVNPEDEEFKTGNAFRLSDKTSEYPGISLSDYTRVIEIETSLYRQRVFITAMPSFLKYAIGSRGFLTINGSPYIDGNVYSNLGLDITRNAEYIYKNVKDDEPTALPAITENKEVFVENEGNITLGKIPLHPSEIKKAFDGNPIFNNDETTYVAVDIHKTFLEKLTEGGFTSENLPSPNMSDGEKQQFIRQFISKSYTPIDELRSSQIGGSNKLYKVSDYGLLYPGDTKIDADEIELEDDQWLIINGDATFESKGKSRMDVKANILVTGDLTIKGNFSFHSVIYVLGKTTLNNVKIVCYQDTCNNNDESDDAVLILMTQGFLDIARINEFTSITEDETEDNNNQISGYLYTASDAIIYAVGSLLNIDGGIFSGGNLIVNSYRGNADENDSKTGLIFYAKEGTRFSRLKIKNDNRLFLNQAQGLPKVNNLEVIPGRLVKN
ncbi:hypothetical protein CVD28_14545 [Bacillus sp. M6-12]|uniref:hypothetical protein n=1 Tax=Bacillus sp. M6-12 TaxID=2054166 RepID=UPI000C78FCA7|nr:hypothetical protein [Bacillus sp. M6-12]PLS16872.1 hypothetical protein CVD28_14545 [Bacillus sp. M6-12]